jgi:hypothetical protein
MCWRETKCEKKNEKRRREPKECTRPRAYLEDVMSIYANSPWYTANSHLRESWLTVEIDFS